MNAKAWDDEAVQALKSKTITDATIVKSDGGELNEIRLVTSDGDTFVFMGNYDCSISLAKNPIDF